MSMKWFLRIVVVVAVLILGALGWQWLAADPGFVQLRLRGYIVETTAIVAVAFLVFGLAALWLLLWLLRAPVQWLAGRRRRRARHAFAQAELRLREGLWAKAEKLFVRAADDPDFRIPALLEAAQAAHSRGDAAQAQAYLAQLETDGEGRRLARLERAREALASERPEETLAQLAGIEPEPVPPSASLLRIEALRAGRRSVEALAELPVLQRSQLLEETRYARIEQEVACAALAEADDGGFLDRIWDGLPKAQKRNGTIVAAYAERAAALTAGEPAAVIESQLRHEWDEDLVRLYGRLEHAEPLRRIRTAEQWLAAHADSVGLNVALGRLCLRAGQAGKAEDYLGHALSLAHDAEAWELLAELFGQKQPERARVALLNTLRSRRGEPPLNLPGGTVRGDHLGMFAVAEERSEHGVPRLPPGAAAD